PDQDDEALGSWPVSDLHPGKNPLSPVEGECLARSERSSRAPCRWRCRTAGAGSLRGLLPARGEGVEGSGTAGQLPSHSREGTGEGLWAAVDQGRVRRVPVCGGEGVPDPSRRDGNAGTVPAPGSVSVTSS